MHLQKYNLVHQNLLKNETISNIARQIMRLKQAIHMHRERNNSKSLQLLQQTYETLKGTIEKSSNEKQIDNKTDFLQLYLGGNKSIRTSHIASAKEWSDRERSPYSR